MPSDEYQNEAFGGQKFVPNNVWASTPAQGVEEELTLPSGQTCRAKKMSIEAVITTGMLNEVDSLTGLVDGYTRKVKGGNGRADGVEISDDMMKDSDALGQVISMVDSLMPHVVVSPVVYRHWTEQKVGKTVVRKMLDPLDRVQGRIYTDQIDLNDKMHLFEWALGGLAAFSSFRGESAGDVGDVAPGAGNARKGKRRPRNR